MCVVFQTIWTCKILGTIYDKNTQLPYPFCKLLAALWIRGNMIGTIEKKIAFIYAIKDLMEVRAKNVFRVDSHMQHSIISKKVLVSTVTNSVLHLHLSMLA